MVAFPDELIQFRDGHPILSEIARFQFHFPFFQERFCLAARGAIWFMQEFDFRSCHSLSSPLNLQRKLANSMNADASESCSSCRHGMPCSYGRHTN
jgi:hypothetical protein